MRRTIFPTAIVLLAGIVGTVHQGTAQSVRLNAYGGYTFADQFNFGGYTGYDQAKFDESGHWGAGLEVEVRPLSTFEVYYQQQTTTGRLLGSLSEISTDVKVEYLTLNPTHYAGNDLVKGFAGLMLGAAFFSSDAGNNTKFGWGGRLGLLITPNERYGIRLGAQLLSAVQGGGGGFYFGTGGAGAGVSTYSSLYQFGLFGGIAINLGGGRPAARSSVPPPAPAPPTAPAPGVPPPPPPR